MLHVFVEKVHVLGTAIYNNISYLKSINKI